MTGDQSAPTLTPLGIEDDPDAIDARIQYLLNHPTLAARYEVVRKLGQGGMGALFWARDRQLERDVALKLMLVADEEAVARFEREGRALARLSHSNILEVFAVEVCEGVPVLVLELLRGVMLSSVLRLLGPYPPEQAVTILSQVLEGLAAAHDAGIAHRDLKPGNLLLLGDRTVKIVDFGLARGTRRDDPALSRTLTADGIAVGTRGYIAPEQWWGSHGDARSDMYAVGLIFHEMLTGELPPSARGGPPLVPALHDEQVQEDLARAAIAPAFRRFLERALRADPDQRFAGAREMLAALRTAAGTRPGSAPAASVELPPSTAAAITAPADRTDQTSRGRRPADTGAALAICAGLACTLIALVTLRPWRAPEPRASASASARALRVLAAAERSAVPTGTVEVLAGLRGYSDGDLCRTGGGADHAVRMFRKAALVGNPYGQWLLGRMLLDGWGVVCDGREGLRWMRRAADAGVPAAIRGLGEACERGFGRPPDLAEAAEWYRRAALKGSARGAAGLGAVLLRGGPGLPARPEEAVQWLRAAAGRGETRAIVMLAGCYRDGTGTAPDPAETVRWFRRGAEELDPDAIYGLARCALDGVGMVRNDAMGLDLCQQASTTNGDAAVCAGDLTLEGRGCRRDAAAAVDHYLVAVSLGSATAHARLARIYLGGHGVPADPSLAVTHLMRGAELGDPEACAELSWCLDRQVAVRADLGAAMRWCRVAVTKGHSGALVHLGLMWLEGRGVAADAGEAVGCFRRAAGQGSASAQWRLGTCYRLGRGVAQDQREAARWFRAAADQGLHEAMLETAAAYAQGTATDAGEAARWFARARATAPDRETWPTREEQARSAALRQTDPGAARAAAPVASPAAADNLAQTLVEGSRLYEQARSDIERGGTAYAALLDQAIERLDRVVAAGQDLATALCYAGSARLARGDEARGDLARARDELQRSLALERRPYTLLELAQADGLAGDARAQCAHLEQALELSPAVSEIHYRLAIALAATNDPAQVPLAVDHARTAMRLEPGCERKLKLAPLGAAVEAALWPPGAETRRSRAPAAPATSSAGGVDPIPPRQLHWMTLVDGDEHLRPLLRLARDPAVRAQVESIAPGGAPDPRALWRAAMEDGDATEAAWLLRRAAASGDFDPLIALAIRMRRGQGAPADPLYADALVARAIRDSEAWEASAPDSARGGLANVLVELEHELHRATSAKAGWRFGRVVGCALERPASPAHRATLRLRCTAREPDVPAVVEALVGHPQVDGSTARVEAFRIQRSLLDDGAAIEVELVLPLLIQARAAGNLPRPRIDWRTMSPPAPLPITASVEARAANGERGAQLDLAVRLFDADRVQGAAWARKAALQSDDPGCLRVLASYYVALPCHRDQAERMIAESISARPDEWTAHQLAAILAERRGASELALMHILNAVRLNPRDPGAQGTLAWIYERLGRYAESDEAARQQRILAAARR